ncbi:MAG: DUF1724 domain-containing protein [Methanobrevibacter sp.]|jgi:predicted transcriptional regulator|nr:DUF1724 domain-containing protein [Candidatus Methanoflexus mossambicus]
MKNKITKKELKTFNILKKILNSKIRTSIILHLYSGEKNLFELRSLCDIPSSSISHSLKSLKDMEILKKKGKTVKLTTKGYMIAINLIKLIESWHLLVIREEFWSNHDTRSIPENLFDSFHLLTNMESIKSSINNISKPLTSFLDSMQTTKNLKIVLPNFSKQQFNSIMQLIEKDQIEVKMIVSQKLMSYLETTNFKSKIKEHLTSGKLKINEINEEKTLFLAIGEKFIYIGFFFKDGHYDDSTLFYSDEKEAILWGKKLFKYLNEETISNLFLNSILIEKLESEPHEHKSKI